MIRRFQSGVGMRGTRHRSSIGSGVAVLCAVCFLTVSLGSVSRADAAETWETWPKKTAEPGVEAKPSPPGQPAGAAKEGEEAGKDVKKGVSSGTIGWITAGAAGVIAILIAASGGNGGSTTTTSHH